VAKQIVSNFKQSVSNGCVSKIWRIQNVRLWRWYYLYRQEIAERNQGEANEKLVWHGTDINNIDDIVQNGFDFRLSRDGAIGSGIYFAASAVTSLSYVRNGQKMLLCRTALGQSAAGRRGYRRPPERYRGILFDSVDGNLSGDAMFCIFDNRQSYPEWVIEYSSQPQNFNPFGFTNASLFNNIVVPTSIQLPPVAQQFNVPQITFPANTPPHQPPPTKHPVFSFQ